MSVCACVWVVWGGGALTSPVAVICVRGWSVGVTTVGQHFSSSKISKNKRERERERERGRARGGGRRRREREIEIEKNEWCWRE